MKTAFTPRLLKIVALIALVLVPNPMLATSAAPPSEQNSAASPNEAPIEFWNREIVVLRTTLAGSTPQDRADRAVKRLEELPLNASEQDLVQHSVKIEDRDGIAFTYQGRGLFYLASGDLDKESGETLEQASQRALRNLNEALEAREAERKWPIIRSGLFLSLTGLLLLLLIVHLIWRFHTWLVAQIFARQESLPGRRLRLFGADLLPYILTIARSLLRAIAWTLTISAIYVWIAFSLRRFPYTQPWGNQLGNYLLQLLQQFGLATVHALPGILEVFIIFTIARWIVHIGKVFFNQVATGRMRIPWIDPDMAQATYRIFSVFVWVFAVVVAYPYIPGSNTDAFKGVSVFIGLVISLGSTGIINQVISGLFVVYSKALKTGEWVRINEVEGEVLEVGPLAAKIRTIEGQEVTVPNSVLVATLTTNYTRLGQPHGMIASTTVTIGYDAPWRQVHALLQLAAQRTNNIRKQPEPYVLQRQLSDFYPEYTLIVRLQDPKLRIETLSHLHSNIQDAFNESGVQIMSPHYMVQPERSVVIPRSKWHPSPTPAPDSPIAARPQRIQPEE